MNYGIVDQTYRAKTRAIMKIFLNTCKTEMLSLVFTILDIRFKSLLIFLVQVSSVRLCSLKILSKVCLCPFRKIKVRARKIIGTNIISKLKNLQTSFQNFIRNTDALTRICFIPPHPPIQCVEVSRSDPHAYSVRPSENTMKMMHNCLIYGVEKLRVLTATLCGFYRYIILGGLGVSNNPTQLNLCNIPPNLRRLLWRV